MKIVTYLTHVEELSDYKKAQISEVLLCHQELSRTGTLSTEETLNLAKLAKKEGIKTVLEWDLLLNTEQLEKNFQLIDYLCTNNSAIDSIRVMDMGALERLKDKFEQKLQLCLETGHHNFLALHTLCKYLGPKLEKMILSLELPKDILAQYIQNLPVEIEIMGLGPLLIFYSPRPLLSAQVFNKNSGEKNHYFSQKKELLATGTSEESPHRGFTLLENMHGTLMYLPKHHCLLEVFDELKNFKLHSLRVDLRRTKVEHATYWSHFWSHPCWPDLKGEQLLDLIKNYPYPKIRGFFSFNGSDKLFPKLKNSVLQSGQDSLFLGHIIEAKRGQYLALKLSPTVKNLSFDLTGPISVLIYHPEGEEIKTNLKDAKNAKNQLLSNLNHDSVVFFPYQKGVVAKSAVYYIQKN